MIRFEPIQTNVGPNNGNLENPNNNPVRRQAEFRPHDGNDSGMHRFEDTAMPGLKNEQPWHSMAAQLLLVGKSNGEIAEAAGVTTQSISTLRAQRWFQEKIATLAAKNSDAINAMIQAEAMASIETIVELRDSPVSGARTRLSAAVTLLEHATGKPVQKVVSLSASTSFSSAAEEMAAIQRDLEALRSSQSFALAEGRESQNFPEGEDKGKESTPCSFP